MDNQAICVSCGNYSLFEHIHINSEGNHICDNCKDQYYFECEECGELHHNDDWLETSDYTEICKECFDNNYFECEDCNSIYHNDEKYTVDNETDICGNCIDDYFYCEGCGTYHHDNSTNQHNVRGYTYCTEYAENHYYYCNECDEYYTSSETTYNENDNYICIHCFPDRCFICEDCDETYNWDDRSADEHLRTCAHCANEIDNSIIKNYSYKPNPHFYDCNERTSEYFGIEIEVSQKNNGNKNNCAETLDNYDFLYMKEDASVTNGFEIVTHPLSYKFIKKHIPNILEITRKDMKGYRAKSCGIHIHVPKKYLSNLQLAKVLLFFQFNEDFILTISQRENINSLNQWSSIVKDKKENFVMAKTKAGYNRYRAINLCNSATIEFRIFQSNLSEAGFFKNIEFIRAIKQFVKITSIQRLYKSEFIDFVSNKRKEYSNLFNFLAEKGEL